MVTNAPEMPGIRLYGSPRARKGCSDPAAAAAASRGSTFSLLFRSILPELSKHRWFFPGGLDTFRIPGSWYDGEPGQTKIEQMLRLLVDVPGPRRAERPHLFTSSGSQLAVEHFAETVTAVEAWLPCVDDDWNEIYVFDGDGLSREEIVRLEDEQPVPQPCPPAALAAWAKAYFYNYDGCYWSCYSWDGSLLGAVKAELASSWGARVVHWSDLERHRVTRLGVAIAIVECTIAETQQVHKTPVPRQS